MTKAKYKEGITTKGIHILTLCDVSNLKAERLENKVRELERKDPEAFASALKDFHKACAIEKRVLKNVTPTSGRSLIAQALTGQLTTISDIEINYVALGTSSTAESQAQTDLVAEVYRKLFASMTYASNIAYVTAFYASTDTNGTYQEHGIFINGTASADSGTMISRLLTGALVKTALESLTVETSITLSDA